MLLGIHLTLMIGPTIAVPAPFGLAEALTGVEVTHNDQGKSGFQLTFQVGRSGPFDLLDFDLLRNPLLRPFNRVVLVVRFNILPQVLMDGIITQIQLSPSSEPGGSTLTVIGEDVSVMMDMHHETRPWPAMLENVRVGAILAFYPQFQWLPLLTPPFAPDVPVPIRMIPQQNGTDLAYINELAARYGYVFFVRAGPAPMTNYAYWGPPPLFMPPQPALSVNMGPQTNVDSINFSYDGLSPTIVMTYIQDSDTNLPTPVITPPLGLRPPMALMPGIVYNGLNYRVERLDVRRDDVRGLMEQHHINEQEARQLAGLNFVQAYARAQATVDRALAGTVTATGELDSLRYGAILEARGIVGVRGAGLTYDGRYYVKSVSHSIRKGEYKQRFTLQREGVISMDPLVRP